jgi:hypothetical protein
VNLMLTATGLSTAAQQAGFTYRMNWGDGTAQNPDVDTISPTANNGAGVSISHTYASSGAYQVGVTATDIYSGVGPTATAVVVIGTASADTMTLCGGANPGGVKVNLNGSVQTFHPTELVLASGLGGGDTYSINFGNTLTTPLYLFGGGSSSNDTLIGNGDNSATNVINKTAGQITWGNPVTETVYRSGIPNTVINANGTSNNYINDPGGNTIINGGPGQNTIVISATTGTGVLINGGGSANSYIIDLGSLAGPVTINNTHTTAVDSLVVNGAAGNNTITASGNQVTAATQAAITLTAPLASATINGGSGNNQITVSNPTVPIQNLNVSGGAGTNSITLVNVGARVASLAISDPAGSSNNQVQVQGSLPPTVNVPNAPPVVGLGNSANVALASTFNRSGSFVSPAASFTATVNYGDGSGTVSLPLTAKTFNLGHVYAGAGDFTITVKVTDNQGQTGIGILAVHVNAPPVVTAINGPVSPVQLGTAIAPTAPFTDQNPSDTHTALWNWGDGSTSTGAVTEANGAGTVSSSHTYAATGVYTVGLTVTDSLGTAGALSFQYAVIYDPSGGFVTGGGWINSPAGAYVANPSFTGKANFGFDSRYQKGASAPTGNTQFSFKVANLDFHSTSYDWLVVAGAKAQYKGSGQINNAGNDGFMLTAIDGALPGGHGQDTFRIKIWDKNTGNTIYDNQLGQSDTSDPTTALGGGSIVIHSSNQLLNEPPIEGADLPPLTLDQVRAIEAKAIRLWVAAGAEPGSFKDVDVRIVDLPGSGLGLAAADTIWLDRDAAGHGWFVDQTPADTSDLRGTELIPFYAGEVDLLTVMAHELGHVLGYDDSGTDGLMAEYLGTGVRRLPTPQDMENAMGHTVPALPRSLRLEELVKDPGLLGAAVQGVAIVTVSAEASELQVPLASAVALEPADVGVKLGAKHWASSPFRLGVLAKTSIHARDAVFGEVADQPLFKDLSAIDSK